MRAPEQTRKQILEAAFWQVFEHGFQGVSVSDIIAKTTVTKGAFFHHFPTKNDLGYALVDETIRELTLDRWIRPLQAYDNALDGILALLRQTIEQSSEEQLSLGCPLNNLIQEMSAVDDVFREKLLAILELWISGIEAALLVAQQKGYLSPTTNPRQVAEFVVMTHEGAFGISKSFRDKQIFWSLYESLELYLSQLRVTPKE